jgi:tetratricopeptide (TPR) repeat protein
MRVFVIFSIALLAPLYVSADVIHLKNGRTIWADHARENGTKVEYDRGEDSYAIPKASVERIEQGGVPPQYAVPGGGSKDVGELPSFAPAENLKNEDSTAARIVRDGKIDSDALRATEQEGSAAAATAYYVAGKFEFEHANFSKAQTYLETALRFDSENATVLNYLAAVLVRTGNSSAALPYAQRAVRIAPDSADTLAVLGYAQYASDRIPDAIRSWKKSLQIRPDATVQALLEKAQRDATAEAEFSQNESSHFSLKYEGKQTSDAFRRALIVALEAEYDDLVRDLGVAPRTIAVILYTDQAFFDVTQAPSWSGAVNDGKLRIPVDGVSTVTPELARVLKHELAHSFINQAAAGRCPHWLNEGVAQALEPKTISDGRRLADLYKTQREIPLNVLEGSFMRFSNAEAYVAYLESLAAVQYIVDTYGMSDVRRILERIGEGSSAEAALRATMHSDYGQFEDEVGKYLAVKYGS